jgi:hypothetical protein
MTRAQFLRRRVLRDLVNAWQLARSGHAHLAIAARARALKHRAEYYIELARTRRLAA